MPILRVKSVKIYTGQKKFTRAPPVAPVTNMRYVNRFTYSTNLITRFLGREEMKKKNEFEMPHENRHKRRNTLTSQSTVDYILATL